MLNLLGNEICHCGKKHIDTVEKVIVGKGAISQLPDVLSGYNASKVFVLADCNTFDAAGKQVCAVLDNAGIDYSRYIFPDAHLEPDEKAVGSAILHFDHSCDVIVGVGSGVINDIGKILSRTSGKKYIIVGTAPSMDGYASDTSSMAVDGLKVSIRSRCADVIIGDTDILKNAPMHMLQAGLGDMLAKYVSIAEWRMGNLILDEYYCEDVAKLVRKALKKCVDSADGLLKRDEKAVEAMFEGLAISGVAMAYAEVSRPASGMEHYFSHIWDMRGLVFGTPIHLHGTQCAMGTLLTARLYDKLKTVTPDKAKAKAYVDAFCYEDWKQELRTLLGNSAETMIAIEEKERKYDKSTHPARLERICEHWDEILRIVDEELPTATEIERIFDAIGLSKDLSSLNVTEELARKTFFATKDIRDKYILSRLAWDLGILEELWDM